MTSAAPLICTIGDLVTDVVVRLDRDPQRGTDTSAVINTTRGGSAANVAVAAVHAGGCGRFVGQVGDDSRGAGLVASLEADGVDARVATGGVTGTIVVLVDANGERSFLTDRGASAHLSAASPEVLDGVDVFHVPLYSLSGGGLTETTMGLIGEAIDREIPVTLSTSSVAVLREFGRPNFLSLVKNISPSVVFANRSEAEFVLGAHPWFTHAGATVVTAGAAAARYSTPEGIDHREKPEVVEIVDSTGAGDAFTAGFLVSWINGGVPPDWLNAGHRLARRTLEVAGATLGSISQEEDRGLG